MRKTRWFLAALLCAAAPAASAAQDTSPDLRWKLKKGDILIYEHKIEQSFRFSSDRGKIEYAQMIEAVEQLEVEQVAADGNFQVKHTVTRLRITVDGKLVYDSEAPQKNDAAAAAMFREAVNQPQTLSMTPGGRIAESRGTSIKDRMNKSFSGTVDTTSKSLPMAVSTLPLPEKALGTGKSWKTNAEENSENGALMISETTYRLDSNGTGGQTILGETTLKLEKAPTTMKLKDGTGRQRAVFDLSSGHLGTSEVEFSVTLENQVQGKGVSVVNSMKCTTRLKERKSK